MKLKYTLSAAVIMGGLTMTSQAVVTVIGDAAGDYVAAAGGPTATLTAFPASWSYLGSTAATGGALSNLTAGGAGTDGGPGFTGVSAAGTAAVQGTDPNGGDYELFGNGDPNGGVIGEDLLLHPGQAGNADAFVIARYTVGDASTYAAGTGAIAGNFRDLIVGGGAASESVEVAIYQGTNLLFSTEGGTTAQGTQGILTEAAGTFDLTGLTFATGDTIDFVVGINGHFGADETALEGIISVDVVPEPSVALLGGFGLLALLRRRRA